VIPRPSLSPAATEDYDVRTRTVREA
jgi:hypothetical protein